MHVIVDGDIVSSTSLSDFSDTQGSLLSHPYAQMPIMIGDKDGFIQKIRDLTCCSNLKITIDPRRVNYILIYYGSFNPPHMGHLDFLKHSHQHVGDDMNIACALVVPRSENFLRDVKFRNSASHDEPLILSQSCRKLLFESDHRWPSWAGVVGDEILEETVGSIRDETEQCAIRIQFLALRGVDTSPTLTWEELSPNSFSDMILVNTYGRQCVDELRSWELDSFKWDKLKPSTDLIQIHQMALGTRRSILHVKGFVRVIWSREPYKSNVSSSDIRLTAKQLGLEAAANNEYLRTAALSWNLLQAEPSWRRWSTQPTQVYA